MFGDGEVKCGLLGDGTESARVPIGHVQTNGMWERSGGDVVLAKEVGVDERFLSTRVNQGLDGDWWEVTKVNGDRNEERDARRRW
jgi:hypothetical protein